MKHPMLTSLALASAIVALAGPVHASDAEGE